MNRELTSVELESVVEHVVERGLTELDAGVRVEQALVIVVSDTTSVLYHTDHVTHSRPLYTLQNITSVEQ